MQISKILTASVLLGGIAFSGILNAEELAVKITKDLGSVTVKHEGKDVVIMRNQEKDHKINPLFTKTSRHCPPFCVAPMSLHADVETIGELDVLDYLNKASNGDKSILVVDSRTPEWLMRGTIPGAINVPWLKISPNNNSAFEVEEIANRDAILTDTFGAKKADGDKWNFSNAKTLVMFCNGSWCEQSPNNIHTLLGLGYPPAKIKWYRGGMQDWEMLGLTTIKGKR
ncbi:rhodanese-like domain-containing protein [Candidatus Venteria ishoeyi]|uniref:Rhodanese-like domain protein n=1 Tax=Candidatus Venteria ishoeyi TaxID=1899563 RepID=A0A1H6FAW1_9GAMM|nr:rhodanese-like domain-containing protein [Candidatus Venteria ishoeyi]MDM8545344.1 rhodanese-like domain-containing protein [Candidatus Venteria ishoeyi]SEH07228.1 Rhodanese-like domain protein [Candidatus Venteria ishoeyi]